MPIVVNKNPIDQLQVGPMMVDVVVATPHVVITIAFVPIIDDIGP
jgi:hypothetical protein